MCEQKILIENNCAGACKKERFRAMSVDELKEEVKKLRMHAVKSATALHDLAEEGLPHRWEEIPKVAQEAYEVHKLYYIAKKILEEKERSKSG